MQYWFILRGRREAHISAIVPASTASAGSGCGTIVRVGEREPCSILKYNRKVPQVPRSRRNSKQ